jgi:hypothetical protein
VVQGLFILLSSLPPAVHAVRAAQKTLQGSMVEIMRKEQAACLR